MFIRTRESILFCFQPSLCDSGTLLPAQLPATMRQATALRLEEVEGAALMMTSLSLAEKTQRTTP